MAIETTTEEDTEMARTDDTTENIVPLRQEVEVQSQIDDQPEEQIQPDSDEQAELEEAAEPQSRSCGPALKRVELIGRIAKGPDLRVTHTGMHFAYFRVATNGRDVKDTEFQCTAFGKTAEFIGQYLTTGRLVYLDGRLQTRAYDDPDGVRRWATAIVVNRLQVLDSRRTDQQWLYGPRSTTGRGPTRLWITPRT